MGICCRHTRYTVGWGSWNPKGGYPELTEFPIIPLSERWQDTDDIQTTKGIQYCRSCEPEEDENEFMMVDQASDTTMGDRSATAASSGARPSTSRRIQVKKEQSLPDVEVSDGSEDDKEEPPMDLAVPNLPKFKEEYLSHFICCKCGARDLVNTPYESRNLVTCWFRRCKHRMCRSCCKEVGFYNPGGVYVLWCRCHDHDLLPETSDAVVPDSDGDYYTEWPEEIRWNDVERKRRENQPRPKPMQPRKLPRR
eukprot:6170788-Amphidinium_carterae.1